MRGAATFHQEAVLALLGACAGMRGTGAIVPGRVPADSVIKNDALKRLEPARRAEAVNRRQDPLDRWRGEAKGESIHGSGRSDRSAPVIRNRGSVSEIFQGAHQSELANARKGCFGDRPRRITDAGRDGRHPHAV